MIRERVSSQFLQMTRELWYDADIDFISHFVLCRFNNYATEHNS